MRESIAAGMLPTICIGEFLQGLREAACPGIRSYYVPTKSGTWLTSCKACGQINCEERRQFRAEHLRKAALIDPLATSGDDMAASSPKEPSA
jgi:hypothetical protein